MYINIKFYYFYYSIRRIFPCIMIVHIMYIYCVYNHLGPSAVGQIFRRAETSNDVPEVLIISSSSSESDGECEIIGYVKPRHERTPEIIELLSSDSEHVSVPHTLNGNSQ